MVLITWGGAVGAIILSIVKGFGRDIAELPGDDAPPEVDKVEPDWCLFRSPSRASRACKTKNSLNFL